MDENITVSLKNACKSYGRNVVLKNFNITVEKGAIYGLLGASGCGKTTLLNCIVGIKSLDSGEVWVLGGKPGSKGSGVPGAKVGFMPQDVGLVGELTVKDTIYYFGKLMKMSDHLIAQRYETLSEVMDLPPSSRYVKNCSGGQQRRVSFAASMVHLPELLILDEPTVGVDPVLRERIWEYLLHVTRQENMTVIITTHYIEEARQADMVGMLRDGTLLVQDSPDNLLENFGKETLEEVFLTLSLKQEKGYLTPASSLTESDRALGDTKQKGDVQIKEKKASKTFSLNRKRLHALLGKNWKQFRNNFGVAMFMLLFPVFQVSAFLVAIGRHVHDIDIAIVNYDSCNNFIMNETVMDKTTSFMYFSTKRCEFKTLSCRFLTYLDNPMFHTIAYDDLDAAFRDGRKGKVKGIIHMAKNFTESYQYRFDTKLAFSDLLSGSNDLIEERAINFDHGQIKVWLDMSYPQIGHGVKGRLLTLFDDFQKDLLKDCHIEPQVGRVVDIQTINGLAGDSFTAYMVPGIVLTIIFYTTTLLTLSTIVTERTEGIWNRAIIAGVSSMEIILSHFLLQVCVVIFYVIEIFCLTFFVFQIETVGSIWIIALSAFLQGIAGLCFGFLMSILCPTFSVALMVTGGLFIIMICICGFMWPIESMPMVLQWFSKCLPFTIPITSFRDVMRRGWGFQDSSIITGFVIEISWILILILADLVMLKLKR